MLFKIYKIHVSINVYIFTNINNGQKAKVVTYIQVLFNNMKQYKIIFNNIKYIL